MAWCQSTSHYLKQWGLVSWRIYTSRGLNDLGIMKNIRRKLARFIYPSWRWNWNPQIYCIEAHPLLRCGCLWVGATSVYFSINYVFVILRILLVFAVGSQYQHDYLSFDGPKLSSKIPCWFKFWMGLWDKYWLSWKRLSFEVFFSCRFDILLK